MLGNVLGLILFVALLVGFNTVALMIVTGKNPILGGGFNFFTGKWEVARHKDTLGSRIFGYLWASVVFFFDSWLLFGVIRAAIK